MPNRHAVICGEAHDGNLPFEGRPLRLRLWGESANVRLRISDISWKLLAPLPDSIADLVEIASYVYCADKSIPRGGDGVQSLGSEWRRELHFRIPVRHHSFWASARARSALESTLGFLTEDEYTFEFEPASPIRPGDQQPLFSPNEQIDDVLLFSGGLDSLAGAVRDAVTNGHRVALVSHCSNPKTSAIQRKLLGDLAKHTRFAPLHVPVRISRSGNARADETQRSRSFLYVSIAAAVASALGRNHVRFYENGIVSINLPIAPQVVGSKATRTTHPRVMHDFAQLLSLATGGPFVVENPFVFKTRGEVVKSLLDADCGDLISKTVSCVHTIQMSNDHPHCGSCSQCIGRRFAVLAAGATRHEPGGPDQMYRVELLSGPRPRGESQTMLSSFVESSLEFGRLSVPAFLSRYGEITRALPYLGSSRASAAHELHGLHRRHAEEVGRVIDEAIKTHSKQILSRSLPPSCLLTMVCDRSAACDDQTLLDLASAPIEEAPNTFRRCGQAWRVRYQRRAEFILVPTKGTAYLHLLLGSPGVPIPASALACQVAKDPNLYQLGDAGNRADSKALAAYRVQYERLKQELAEARELGLDEVVNRVRADMDWIAAEVQKSKGLGGALRLLKDDRNKARKAVSVRIKDTVTEIAKYDRTLADHLTPPRLQLGSSPCYDPGDGGPEWET